jgi:excisionase family DNA binding protein
MRRRKAMRYTYRTRAPRKLGHMTEQSSPAWMGTTEACERLGITLRTLYRLIDEGKLPAYKIGRVIRLKAEEVDAFTASSRITPGDLRNLYPEPKGN